MLEAFDLSLFYFVAVNKENPFTIPFTHSQGVGPPSQIPMQGTSMSSG
jgi:hypothetical protein